jgi:hypothetical protein
VLSPTSTAMVTTCRRLQVLNFEPQRRTTIAGQALSELLGRTRYASRFRYPTALGLFLSRAGRPRVHGAPAARPSVRIGLSQSSLSSSKTSSASIQGGVGGVGGGGHGPLHGLPQRASVVSNAAVRSHVNAHSRRAEEDEEANQHLGGFQGANPSFDPGYSVCGPAAGQGDGRPHRGFHPCGDRGLLS